MEAMKQPLAAFGCAFVLATAIAAVPGRAAGASEAPVIGHPAPTFSLKTLDDKEFSLAGEHGKVVVLHFGAGW